MLRSRDPILIIFPYDLSLIRALWVIGFAKCPRLEGVMPEV